MFIITGATVVAAVAADDVAVARLLPLAPLVHL